jgi:hypothetical protein
VEDKDKSISESHGSFKSDEDSDEPIGPAAGPLSKKMRPNNVQGGMAQGARVQTDNGGTEELDDIEMDGIAEMPFQQKMSAEFKTNFDSKQKEARDQYITKHLNKQGEDNKNAQPGAEKNLNNFSIMKDAMSKFKHEIEQKERSMTLQRVCYAIIEHKGAPAMKFFLLCNDPFDLFAEIQKRMDKQKKS